MKRRACRRRVGGFSLVNVLVAITLLASFMIAGGQLFTSIIRTAREHHRHDAAALRLERLRSELRRDVWAARAVEVDALGHMLTLANRREAPRTETIVWVIDPEAGVIRKQRGGLLPEVHLRTTAPAPNTRFALDGPDVLLQWLTPEGKPVELRFTGAVRRLGGEP